MKGVTPSCYKPCTSKVMLLYYALNMCFCITALSSYFIFIPYVKYIKK